jgi:hypothetical protein
MRVNFHISNLSLECMTKIVHDTKYAWEHKQGRAQRGVRGATAPLEKTIFTIFRNDLLI